MPRRKTASPIANLHEQERYKLRNDLYMARLAIIELMPVDVQSILTSFYSCNSREEAVHWIHNTAKKIVELADARPSEEMGDGRNLSPRAFCPLCGQESSTPFMLRGFAIPEGLLRHLLGSHNSHQCNVFKAAEALGREYLAEKFRNNSGDTVPKYLNGD